MANRRRYPDDFILEAFDRDRWCPVLQSLFRVRDTAALRAVLGLDADVDPKLERHYLLDDHELTAVVTRFNVAFDAAQLHSKDLDICLFRRRWLSDAPYLVHTGYELPLLIDGRKKLARMSDTYPPMTFEGEERFDRWVRQGLLHKEEVVEPFDRPVKGWVGHRLVYYTPKGEEWRIPASKLIWSEFGNAGHWNETLERLEGILYGYEDWQNDWWIKAHGERGGGYSGVSLCCGTTAAGLGWMESAGFRALPPADGPILDVTRYDPEAEAEMQAFMAGKPSNVALVRFNVAGRNLPPILDLRQTGPWKVPGEHVPELNRHLMGPVVIVARRGGD